MSKSLNDLFKNYYIKTISDCINSSKEILQNIILIGLSKSDFFSNAYFYGGTCLRILYGLKRFSEDLDFTINRPIDKEEFSSYLMYAIREIESYNIPVCLNVKNKTTSTSVISSYICVNAREFFRQFFPSFENQVDRDRLIKIKVEIEDNYINKGTKASKMITNPSVALISTYDLSTLFASKLLALLFRKWGNRVKGRDYYDYIFYVNKDISLNLEYLNESLIQNNNSDRKLTIEDIKDLLREKFENANYDMVIEDVIDFIYPDDAFLTLLNKEYLLSTIDKIK